MDNKGELEQKNGDHTGGTPSTEPDGTNPPPNDEQMHDKLNVFILREPSAKPPPITRAPGLLYYTWPYLILSALGLTALVLLVIFNPLRQDGLDHPGAGIYVISLAVMVIFVGSAVLYLLHQILQVLNEQRRRLHEKELEAAAQYERREIRSQVKAPEAPKPKDSSKKEKLIELFKEITGLAEALKVEHKNVSKDPAIIEKRLPDDLHKELEGYLTKLLEEEKGKIV